MASMALGFFSLVLNPRYYGPVWLNSKHTVYALCIAYIYLIFTAAPLEGIAFIL